MVGWTLLILASLPVLCLWTLLARRARGCLHASSPAERPHQQERQKPERRPSPDVLPVLMVKSRGVSPREARRRVTLATAGAATALAGPVHHRALAPGGS